MISLEDRSVWGKKWIKNFIEKQNTPLLSKGDESGKAYDLLLFQSFLV